MAEAAGTHVVSGHSIVGPWSDESETAVFGLGCFWGAERRFWQTAGVHVTAVGYAGGETEHPTYRDVCYTETGHAEVVLVVFDPTRVSYADLLKIFWESHDPTQGMRQGNDIGTQYRSIVLTTSDEQQTAALESRKVYESALRSKGFGLITTEIEPLETFYYAEEYHQQYLAKNPNGYCGLSGTGVTCSIGTGIAAN
jgi:peptide-methionine (S)-S-oxide reductase